MPRWVPVIFLHDYLRLVHHIGSFGGLERSSHMYFVASCRRTPVVYEEIRMIGAFVVHYSVWKEVQMARNAVNGHFSGEPNLLALATRTVMQIAVDRLGLTHSNARKNVT